VRRRLERGGAKRVRPLDVLVAILREKKIRAVSVPERFPAASLEHLRKHGVRVTVKEGMFFPERGVKRPDELAAIRRAQAAAESGVAKALRLLRATKVRRGVLVHKGETVTSEMLRATCEMEFLRMGCIGQHTIVASGDQCVDPHDAGSGKIRPDTSIIFDVFPREAATGYYADMSRTVVRGKASKELAALYEMVREGQQHGIDRVREGVNGRTIHESIQKLFASRGYRTGPRDGKMEGFFHGTGHSLGVAIHEPPGIGARDETLPAGAVVTVEPGLYYRGIGGVRLEDMVLVKKRGCVNLTGFVKELEL
jgi:Xaa-Pro aminopeptidase